MMNYNGDLSKIPIPPYPIPGLSDLIDDLPPGGQGQLHSLPHHDNRHDAASHILNTPDAMLVSQLVDVFSANPTEHMNVQHDPSMVEGLNSSTLLQGVRGHPAEMYGHINLMPVQHNLNPSLSHVGPFATTNPVACSSVQPAFPPDAISNARAPSLYPGAPSRPVVSRPVQAVAPQPRNPKLSDKTDHAVVSRESHQHKPSHLPIAPQVEQPKQEENPKICLKIRRTKKGDRKERHSSKHANEYDIVPSANKPEGAGPIKLKISRLKPGGSRDSSKVSLTEDSFKVSSLIAGDIPMPKTGSNDNRLHTESISTSEHHHSEEKSQHRSKNKKHKHHRPHKSSSTAVHIEKFYQAGPMGAEIPLPQEKPQLTLETRHPIQNPTRTALSPAFGLPPGEKISQRQQYTKALISKSSNVSTSASTSYHMSSAQKQHHVPDTFYSPASHQQQLMLQQKQMVSASSIPPYQSTIHHGSAAHPLSFNLPQMAGNIQAHQLQPTFNPTSMWEMPKQNKFYQSSTGMPAFSNAKPPAYKEALLAQQKAQNELYRSLGQSVASPLVKAQTSVMQKQPTIQQHQQIPVQSQSQAVKLNQQHAQIQPQSLISNQQQQGLLVTDDYTEKQSIYTQQQQQSKQMMYHQTSYLQQSLQTKPQLKSSTKQPQPYQQLNQDTSSHKKVHNQASEQLQAMYQQHSTHYPPCGSPQVILNQLILPQPQPIPRSHYAKDVHTTNSHTSVGVTSGLRESPSTRVSQDQKRRKKGNKHSCSQHVRVKFIADHEEADIYKLKDVMYPDDTEVFSFDDLQPGMEVVAKWPMNGRLYAAIVIDPLDNSGRRFRERKPPPKPFQAGSMPKKVAMSGPSIVLDKLAKDNIPPGLTLSEPLPEDSNDGFNAYISMADRIKLKRRDRAMKDSRSTHAKKLRRDTGEGAPGNLINVDSDVSDEESSSPSKKRSHQSELRKRERRRAAEYRFLHEDGPGSFERLLKSIQIVFDDMDAVDPRILDELNSGGKETEVPRCLLLPRTRLQELGGETAKLKSMGVLNQLPRKVLVRLLTILEPNIRDGVYLKPLKPKGNTAEEQKWNKECKLDRINAATEAALTVMHIMTSQSMPKAVYLDDVIEQTAHLLRNQLNYTIYPEYDLVYRTPAQSKKKGTKELTNAASTRMKRAHYKGTKNRNILQLYNKLNILFSLIVELVEVQPLTDTSILQISSLGISPFFVENVRELQLNAIRLTTAVFSRYDKHRSLILEDIFQSLARLPTSKRNLRTYRLTFAEETVDSSDEEEVSVVKKGGGVSSGELQHIQMMSALVLQMLQAITHLPLPDAFDESASEKEIMLQHQVDEIQVIGSYDNALRTGQSFLSVFLKKCASKSEEIDYRPLFENLIHDLLATVNKPEWPASEMLLSVLGRLLVHTFSTKSTEMSLRVASLDYLGVVAAKLRRDAVTSHTDAGTILALLHRLEEAASEHGQKDQENDGEEKQEPMEDEVQKPGPESEDHKLKCRLQYLLLGYLRRNINADPALMFAHNFYIGQWLRDASQEFQQLQQQEERGEFGKQLEAHSRALQACQRKKDKLMELASSSAVAAFHLTERQDEEGKQKKQRFKIDELQKNAERLAISLTIEDAALVSRHLASTRPFSRAFDSYLSYILRVRDEPAIALRTRAIKCLAEVVAVDPSIMERDDIAKGVQQSLVDASTSVREAAIDLVGRFILLKPDLVKFYYKMLTARILDTGVSVRKRVIRILRDLCFEHPGLPQLTDACVKMIRRVNDEEGIKKLVHEVFMKMWFTPVDAHDVKSLKKKALLITDIVAANKERGYEWIEQLFKNLIDTPTRNPQVEEACRQIVNCLVDYIIVYESPQSKQKESMEVAKENDNDDDQQQEEVSAEKNEGKADISSDANSKQRSVRLVATVQTLVQLSRIRPRLLVPHVMTLQPFLATKCESNDDILTVTGVCRLLELAIPLMEHPPESFLTSVEEDMMRMIMTHAYRVVAAAIACLGAVTARVTHNYRLIWDCFQLMCNVLHKGQILHGKNPTNVFQPKNIVQLQRALLIVGHFCKNFDFDHENFKGTAQVCVKDKVYEVLSYFTNLPVNPASETLCVYAVGSLGFLMVQEPNLMFRNSTKDLYKHLLDPAQKSNMLKTQVLKNLQNYLQTEDVKMQEAAEANVKKIKQADGEEVNLDQSSHFASEEAAPVEEDIKEICDVSSGMASSVMQLFLKQVLETFFHRHPEIRHDALHTIYLTLQQGLVHPVQCIPYLIAAASDPDPHVHKEADQQLIDLNKRYHGFVHTKALQGMRRAYQLQSYIQPVGQVVRGFVERSAGSLDDGSGINLKASCSQLYQLVRSDRKRRRALLLSLLNLFDDTVKTDLELLLFVADNLAYFPYYTLDEPLHLISQIEVYVSVSGSNVLQTFKESLQTKKSKKAKREEKRAAKLKAKEERKAARAQKTSDDSDSSSSSSSDSSSSSESSSDDGVDDSDNDEGSVESRLPARNEAIEEFAHLSLACLLLLWLKQHLKTLFGFKDNKIHRYSPTEVNRANDKQCHRRRPDARFNAKPALDHIMRIKRGLSCRHPEYVEAVIKQYTEFNELMNKLDPNEEDSDSDKEKKSTPKTVAPNPETKVKEEEEMEDSDRDTDDETKPRATLDAIRQSTALKNKKVSKSKNQELGTSANFAPPEMRQRTNPIRYMENSSDSEEEFHGF